MAKLGISTGTVPDDGTGDSLLEGAVKINSNFNEIYNYFGDGTDLDFSSGVWQTTNVGVNTLSYVGIGTTNPRFALEVGAVGSSGTSLWVNADARITGILTIGTSSITIDGTSNNITVGSGVTINGSTGSISASSLILNGTEFTGIGVTFITAGSGISVDQSTGNVTISATGGGGGESYWTQTDVGIHTLSSVGIGTTNPTETLTVVGIVSATSFYGTLNAGQLTGALPAIDGSALTGVVGSGSGVVIEDDATPVGTAGTINFGSNLNVSFASGIATVSGGSTFSNPITVERYTVGTAFSSFTATAGIAHTVDSFTISSTDFKTVEYTIHVGCGSSIQAQKVLAMQNGTTAYSQEYAVMYDSNLLVSIGATVTSGEFRLLVTPEPGVNGIVTCILTREAMI